MLAHQQPEFPELGTAAIAELARLDHWVGWKRVERDGKPTKVPVDVKTGANASVIEPKTWASFARAYEFWHRESSCDGVGFVVDFACPYTGVDLDKCRDPESGEIEGWALNICQRLNSYTEISPSKRGIRIFIRGKPDVSRRRIGRMEVYPEKRFLTVTGWRLLDFPDDIREGGAAISNMLTEAVREKSRGDEARKTERRNAWSARRERIAEGVDPALLDRLRIELEAHADAAAEPPMSKLDAIFANVPIVKETWDKTRKGCKAWTQSEYDLALANFLLDASWTSIEIMQALIALRRKHGMGLKLDRSPRCDYYARTIFAAHQNRVREIAQDAISREALEATPEAERRDVVLKSLSTIYEVSLRRIVRYGGEPPTYSIETDRGRLHGEVEIVMSQTELRRQFASVAGVVIRKAKPSDHDERVQAMLDVAIDEELAVEATDHGQAASWVTEYLDTHPRAAAEYDPEAVRAGNPFTLDGAVWIVGSDLLDWLKTYKRIYITPQKLGTMLRMAGFKPGVQTYGREDGATSSRSTWRVG